MKLKNIVINEPYKIRFNISNVVEISTKFEKRANFPQWAFLLWQVFFRERLL